MHLVTLEALADPARLRRAFDEVNIRKGSAGTDGVTVHQFGADLERQIARLAEELASETYRALPVLRVNVQEHGKTRPLAVPTVRDRVVQRALAELLQPVLEPHLSDAAYAFRPGRGALAAVQAAKKALEEGRRTVVVGDIQRFFERIDHGLLLTALGSFVRDHRLLRLVQDMVRAQVLDHMVLQDNLLGVHQGSPLSPLLSNLYLVPFDRSVLEAGYQLIRYCDDFAAPCRDPAEALRLLELCRQRLSELRLALHPSKTRIAMPGEPFVFLGFRFLEQDVGPSREAVESLEGRLAEAAGRGAGRAELGDILRGWFQYFGSVPAELSRTPEGRLACEGAGLAAPTGEGQQDPTTPGTDERPRRDPIDLRLDMGGILRMLEIFAGREDRYAEERLDSRGQRRFLAVERPLQPEDLQDHLEGRRTLGIFPVRSNGTVRILAFNLNVRKSDLDEDPASREAALREVHSFAIALLKSIRVLGIDALLEDSGSKGRHVWVFFQEAVLSADARRLALRILEAAEPVPQGIVQEHFPDRDRWKPDQCGPALKLPLGLHGRTGRRCWLLEEDGRPVPDLPGALAAVRLVTRSVLESLAPVQVEGNSESGTETRPEHDAVRHRGDPAWSDADAAALSGFPTACRILAACAIVRYLYRKARATAWLSHGERLVLLHSLGHVGTEAAAVIHRIMSFTRNYDRRTTQRWFDSRKDHPISCVRIRETFSGLSAGLSCDCRLPVPRGGYPSPVLHAVAAEEVEVFRQSATEREQKRLAKHPVERAEAERIVARLAELRRQQRGIDKAIVELQATLSLLMDAAGGDRLELSTGTLVRESRETGPVFRIEL